MLNHLLLQKSVLKKTHWLDNSLNLLLVITISLDWKHKKKTLKKIKIMLMNK